MRLELSPAAEQDIRDIYEFGRTEFGERKAESYFEELFEAFERIAKSPNLSRERHELEPPARIHVFHAHLIFYRILGTGVEVVCVLHGHADWQTSLEA